MADGDIGVLAGDGILIDPKQLSFPYGGGNEALSLGAGVSGVTRWELDGGSVPDWCAVEPESGSLPGSATVVAGANADTAARSAEIVFRSPEMEDCSGVLYVTQDGHPSISIDVKAATVSAGGGSVTVGVLYSFGWTAVSADSWLTVTPTQGTGDGTVIVTAEENADTSPRTGTVRFYSDDGLSFADLTVTQDAAEIEPEPEDSFQLQYAGEFLDIKNNTWRCEVLRKTSAEVTVGELSLPADQPLVIEWPSINFEDVMWGSSATLRVVSPGDRTYIDLYTVDPGTIRLDVYKNGSLYWSGMLDPEFYEEPYERLSGYEVELTFTDFGILDRLKYDLTGIQPVRDIISDAVERSGINHSRKNMAVKFDYRRTGIRFGADVEAQESDLFESTSGIAVRSDNFIDEEGEVMTVKEVLEGVLQPLGLKMVQRGGTVSLFDPTGLREEPVEDIPAVVWTGDSQTLGADRVYNSVTVTFSPYAQSNFIENPVSYDEEYSVSWYNVYSVIITPSYGNPDTTGGHTCYSYFPDTSYYDDVVSDDDDTYHDLTLLDLDFTIFLGEGSGVEINGSNGEFFHILPVYGGASEKSGVMYSFKAGRSAYGSSSPFAQRQYGAAALEEGMTTRVFTLPRIYIPAIADEDEREKYFIRLVQEILLDCRYNPFSNSDGSNYNSNQSTLENNSAFVFIRASVALYDSQSGGNQSYAYTNEALALGYGSRSLRTGSWVKVGLSGPVCWLSYYNPEDLGDNAGAVGGWKANRHTIGKPDGGDGVRNKYSDVGYLLQNAPDGEFIPYPPEGGWLEVSIYNAVYGYKYGSRPVPGGTDKDDSWTEKGIYGNLCWWLYGDSSLSIVRNNLSFDDADLDDIEYRGTLNASAQGDLSIDTVCGTCDGAPPTARGLFLRLGELSAVSLMYRDGAAARPETLLINQLYKQYAGRKTVLTGEAETPETLLLTEDNQEGKTFILTADSEDIRMAVSDIEIRELGEDTYTPED